MPAASFIATSSAGIADSYALLSFYGYIRPADGKTKASAAAERAMALDPGLAESHFSMGLCTFWLTERWHDAGRHFLKALEIRPDLAIAQAYYAFYLATEYRRDEARAQTLAATRVDSLSPFAFATSGHMFFVLGEYDEAIPFIERALELQPDFALALQALTIVECQRGNFARALDAASRLVSLSNRASIFLGLLGRAYAAAGRRRDALDVVDELQSRRSREYVIPVADLQIWATLDDRERTRDALVAAIEDGVTGSALEAFLAPQLKSLRRDERFVPLLARLQLRPL
jgi:tetratricopeptide (TPR) repeat protein